MVPAAAETESGFKGLKLQLRQAQWLSCVIPLVESSVPRTHHDTRCDAQCKGFAVFWIPKSV